MEELLQDLKNWYKRTFLSVENEKVNSGFTGHGVINTHYEFGAIGITDEIIKPDGDWTNVDIKFKAQNRNGLESMQCTVYALYNFLKYSAKNCFKEDWDKSERYGGKMCGITQSGGSMTHVLDQTRKVVGCVDDKLWPWTNENTWNELFASIPKSVIDIGKDWTNKYIVKYSVVGQNINLMRAALKRGPLYVCGYAWAMGNDGMYHSWGRANHCFLIVKINDDGSFVAKDSYLNRDNSSFKLLAPDYIFGAIFSVSLKKNTEYNLIEIKKLIDRGLKYILLVSPFNNYSAGVYKLNENGITNQDIIKEINDEGVKSFEAKKELVGISPDNFKKLIS